LLLLSFTASAQLKVFQNGSIAFGSTTAPSNGEKHHFSGSAVFAASPLFPSSNGSSAFIRGNDNFSAAGNPDYSWLGDGLTGLFHPSANAIGLSIGGTEKLRLDNSAFSVTGNTKINGTLRLDGWSDILMDWTNGYCCAMPVIYPENDWYMQLGTPNKWIGLGYISHLSCKQSITFVSDQNFKQNINHNVSDVYERLMKLQPASYNFKPTLFTGAPPDQVTELCNRKQYGLIAQEVMVHFPELVEKDAATNSYGLNYIGLIPMLIEAVKVQHSRIDSLQRQLTHAGTSAGHPDASARNAGATASENSYLKPVASHPFNVATTINYVVNEKSASASVLIFDLNGKLLKTVKASGGSLSLPAGELQPGMYYYSLVVNNTEADTKKLILTE
ncbi:MAG: tail fiber domain-containing protein, partial [Bacteroidia bacterium]